MPRAPDDWRSIVGRGRRLARAGSREGLDLLLSAFRWRYDTARTAAVRAVASVDPPPIPRLLRLLASAETAVERRAAADALGLIRSRRAVPALLGALKDPNMVVRRAAMLALLQLRAREAVTPISRRLRDESGGVRVLAAGVLGRFGDLSAVRPLFRALRDEKWYVRQAAATALGALRDPRAVGPLTRATRDARPAVANAAHASLTACSTPGEEFPKLGRSDTSPVGICRRRPLSRPRC